MKIIVQTGADVRLAHPLTRTVQFAVSFGLLIGCLIEVVFQKRDFLSTLVNGNHNTSDKDQNDYSKYYIHGFNLWGIGGISMEGSHALF